MNNDFRWPIEQINAFIFTIFIVLKTKLFQYSATHVTLVTNVKLEHLMILSLERIMNVTILTWQSIF